MTVNAITDEDIRFAAIMDNLDDACWALQDIAKVDDGGVAAMVFSGFDWNAASLSERAAQIRHWIETERHYEGDGA